MPDSLSVMLKSSPTYRVDGDASRASDMPLAFTHHSVWIPRRSTAVVPSSTKDKSRPANGAEGHQVLLCDGTRVVLGRRQLEFLRIDG